MATLTVTAAKRRFCMMCGVRGILASDLEISWWLTSLDICTSR
jgi:hypothetical protein